MDTYTRGHFLPKFLVPSILTGLRNPAYDRLVAMEVIKIVTRLYLKVEHMQVKEPEQFIPYTYKHDAIPT